MGEKPSFKHSLDRINNNGDYEPQNCKWSTASEQQKNKRKFKQPNNTGSKNKSSKLKEKQVAEIKYLLICTNKTQKDIADYYGVSQACISLIKRHKKWAHVDPLSEINKNPPGTKL